MIFETLTSPFVLVPGELPELRFPCTIIYHSVCSIVLLFYVVKHYYYHGDYMKMDNKLFCRECSCCEIYSESEHEGCSSHFLLSYGLVGCFANYPWFLKLL